MPVIPQAHRSGIPDKQGVRKIIVAHLHEFLRFRRFFCCARRISVSAFAKLPGCLHRLIRSAAGLCALPRRFCLACHRLLLGCTPGVDTVVKPGKYQFKIRCRPGIHRVPGIHIIFFHISHRRQHQPADGQKDAYLTPFPSFHPFHPHYQIYFL